MNILCVLFPPCLIHALTSLSMLIIMFKSKYCMSLSGFHMDVDHGKTCTVTTRSSIGFPMRFTSKVIVTKRQINRDIDQ